MPLREPEEILRMVVAMHKNAAACARACQRFAPQRTMFGLFVGQRRTSERQRHKPLGHQVGFRELGVEIVFV